VIVVDASVVLELILQTTAAAAVADELLDDERSRHAPRLIDLEVAQVLRRWVRAGTLGVKRAREALDDFAALRIERYRTSRCWTASGVSETTFRRSTPHTLHSPKGSACHCSRA
jgi:predicted nucleic acid-binding protein